MDRINGGKILLKPIQLPSGKIIDLDKCLAIVPSATSSDSEVVLSGIEHHIQIDSQDLETLRREIGKHKKEETKYLNLETTLAERVEKSRKFNEIWDRLAARDNAGAEAKILMQIIDAERPSGQKLYSEE
jgi:hypothetical protein